MTLAEETKHAAIRELLEKIRTQKVTIQEIYEEIAAKESKLDSFTVGYDSFVTELRSQRRDLEFQIRRTRAQIMALQSPEDESITDDTEYEEPPVLTPELSMNTPFQNQDDGIFKKKQAILHHFARFWHPDVIKDDSDKMTELNTLFSQSEDEIDLLAAIPWDEAWEKPEKKETFGTQWERLVDWYADLQIAQQRLINRSTKVEQHPFYPLIVEWESHENKSDYFASLAEDERSQIHQLEETFRILQHQLTDLAKGT